MGIFRASRTNRGADPYFRLKVIIFAIGGALGIAGMSSGRDWVVALGIGVLSVGIVLRMLALRNARKLDRDDEQPD